MEKTRGRDAPPRCLQGFFKVILKIKVCLILKLLCFLLMFFFCFAVFFKHNELTFFSKQSSKNNFKLDLCSKSTNQHGFLLKIKNQNRFLGGGYPQNIFKIFFW